MKTGDTERRERVRVLLLAEVAHPDMVSVPLIGWSMSEALFRHADVHLVTHIRNRDALVARGLRESVDFTAIDTEKLTRRLFRMAEMLGARDNKGWTLLQAVAPLGCYAFENAAWKYFRLKLEAGQFDIVHRLTPISPTTPSILGPRLKRLGIPFVVGPLNGGLPWPPGFAARMHQEREWLSLMRGAYRFLPGYRSTRRCASAIIAGSQYTLSELPTYARNRIFYLPENGVDPVRFGKSRRRRAEIPLRGVFLGRLVPYKCADILLEAGADLLRGGFLHLDIIGDGPQRSLLEKIAKREGVEQAVTMHGHVEHRQVQHLLAECDFLACPSIREFGGGVVLEAMALGVAPIVADYGGPTELVDDESGIRVPFSTTDDLRDGFRSVLERVVRDPSMLDRVGSAAAVRVRDHFTWDRKAQQMLAVYDWVRSGKDKPYLIPTATPPG